MNGRQAPRVKLPAAIPRKPVMSGPPEPARYFQEQHGTKYDHTGTSQVTKKDKYEHKPMPPTPTNDGSPPRSYLQPKRYIQPAIPLVSPVSSSHHPKKRAVTDPVVPKPLFAKKQPSVSQLRRKFSNLKENEGASDEEAVEGVIVDNPAPRLSSEKAARILGLYPVYNSRSTTPAVSAPNSVILNPVHDTHDTEGAATPSRQVQSTPVPTRRYLQENGLPTPTLVEPLGTPERPGVEAAAISLGREREEINVTSDNGMLHPHKVGTFGNVSDIGLVQESGMHRIESFRGVIETASPERVSHNDSNATPNSGHVRFDTEGRRHDEAGLTPSVNTPSAYAGVWENDPAVGYSLPPFSPMPNGHTTNKTINGRDQCQDPVQPRYENKRSSHASVSGSLYNTSSNPGFNRFPEFQRPTPSANSWASDSHGNSLTSFDPPLSALLPPHWPHHQLVNSVPSPPANQNDFQRAGSVTATLNQLEMTLHHHIDSSFASLSRLVTDHHERAMDQILRRLDKLEDIVGKGFRNMKTEVKDVRKEVGSHSAEIRYISRGNDRAKELMEELDHKLQKTQEYMDDYICKCHMSTPEHSSSEPENNRIRQAATHRRTESANGVLGSGTPGKRYQNRVNRSSTSARRSDTSNTRYRSNTLDSQADKSTSDEKSMRREYFAELGATRGPVPDLREHPAYASIPQNPPTRFEQELNAKKNGQPYDSPSLSDGRWYQQAYGQPL